MLKREFYARCYGDEVCHEIRIYLLGSDVGRAWHTKIYSVKFDVEGSYTDDDGEWVKTTFPEWKDDFIPGLDYDEVQYSTFESREEAIKFIKTEHSKICKGLFTPYDPNL